MSVLIYRTRFAHSFASHLLINMFDRSCLEARHYLKWFFLAGRGVVVMMKQGLSAEPLTVLKLTM